MHQLKSTELLALGLMMFSIFFGAGNLIFPPALGQAAGTNLVPAMLGFLATGVGLPLLGVVAIALAGGAYIERIHTRLYPWFATALLVILYLVIGPFFAMPRTGAVSFEIGIRPFLDAESITLGQAVYTAIFFGAAYYLALNPSKLMDRIGKMLTPILLLFLAVLIGRTLISPLGSVMDATGAYVAAPFAQGFQDGYQTMDLLATIAIGTIVVNAARMRGVQGTRALGEVTLLSGLISVVLMSAIYLSLSYLGATSASVLGHSENGGQLLAAAVGMLFGPWGNLLLAVIIALACLTTCCGITSGAAWFFNKLFKNKISYERLLLGFLIFSFLVSNVGLTQIIALAVPFLLLIYPLVIVFVVLSLFDSVIGTRPAIYRGALLMTLAFSAVDALSAAGLGIPALTAVFSAYIPFYGIQMGWLCPAIAGALLGGLYSLTGKQPEVEMQKG